MSYDSTIGELILPRHWPVEDRLFINALFRLEQASECSDTSAFRIALDVAREKFGSKPKG